MPISVDLGFVVDSTRPVLSLSLDVFETQCAEKHRHPRAQLIYSSKGSMKVVTQDSVWLVSSSQAIWVPADYEHQVHFIQNNHIRNLFIDPAVSSHLPDKCFALNVSPFLRELILKIADTDTDTDTDDHDHPGTPRGRLVSVLLDELANITPAKIYLPVSNDFHLKKVMETLISDPGDRRNADEFATLACTSSRTLARLFVREVGLTFGDWRKRLRLMVALEKLEKGMPVSQVSIELGYNSISAFIEMFRKEFGVSPGNFLEK
jgi:AraC-like DNA-binding protein